MQKNSRGRTAVHGLADNPLARMSCRVDLLADVLGVMTPFPEPYRSSSGVRVED